MEINLNNYEKRTIGNSASGLIVARTHDRAHLVPTIQAGEIEAYIVNDTIDNYVNLYSQKFVLYAFSKDVMKIYDDNGIGSLFEAEEIRLWTRDNVCVVELSNAPEAPKRTRDEIRDDLLEALGAIDDDDVMDLWNDLRDDMRVRRMDDLDDELYGMSATEIITSTEDLDLSDNFFYNDCGEYRSINDIYDVIDLGDLADGLMDGDISYYDSDAISGLLTELEGLEG